MLNSRRLAQAGTGLLGIAVGFVFGALVVTGNGNPEAQAAVKSPEPTVTYSAGLLDKILSKNDGKFKEIFAFPGQPVFLLRTGSHLTVWQRTENGVRSLMEVPLPNGFDEIVFLDDQRTFIVKADNSAAVYRLNRFVSTVEK